MIASFIGSLGLFLLGMWLMTEGLKLAGGQALSRLLGRWTSSRYRGFAAGVMITALVQSSSAVTVATIGFVNAGLMTFQRAVWVVFGSNLGTTFTAWIVTFFGFTVDLDSFTFPLVGIGAALRIFAPYDRGKALGMALAGFGLLFMGIDALQGSFGGYAQQANLQAILGGPGSGLTALVIGFGLTALTQSSSAAIAIILTAVASGVAGLDVAAAAVIGANVGTTSTALLASLGATAQARRLALAHVAFNLITAAAAMLALPLFAHFLAPEPAPQGQSLILLLAVFHTGFNLLGVLLMWGIEPALSRKLLSLFEPRDHPVPSHLDANVATVPDLALQALSLELNDLLKDVAQLRLPAPGGPEDQQAFVQLNGRLDGVNGFIAQTLKANLTRRQSDLLSQGLTVSHHLRYACSSYEEVAERYANIEQTSLGTSKSLHDWFALATQFASAIERHQSALPPDNMAEMLNSYRNTKKQLLRTLEGDKIEIQAVDLALQAASLSRRFVEQILHAKEAYGQLSSHLVSSTLQDSAFVAPSTEITELSRPALKETSADV
ncbi:Na/Pi cotransporter family protein [Gilvimarinus sp. F26214L]|uniref:Na/Pi cotransporter family protein n=1 Tax=Gilvimarinus sp. DZF01 TaxID=3461371 RepID=UPI004046693F